MTRRIFRSLVVTAVVAVLLAALLSAVTLYSVYERGMTDELRAEAGYLLHALDREADEAAFFEDFSSKNRVTLIAADGTVLFDSSADAQTLGDHSDRPEVAAAMEGGWGESERYSDTLSETTYYYAVRTADGNVLRIASTRSSVVGMFLSVMPLVFAVLLCAVLLALPVSRAASRRIVAPLNALNLDEPLENEVYDELSPLLTRMDRQHREIERQMKALADARHELTTITESMREGLILMDAKGKILSINASAAEIFGVDASNRVGSDLLSVSRSAAVRDAVRSAQTGRSADAILERDAHYYQLLASPVLREDRTVGVVLLTMDVTEKYSAEISRREFTANVSHELRTPLTSISGYAEIIRDGVARPEDVRGFASKIYAEASHLIALINDILELSRLDERKGLGQRETVDLLRIAREAVRRLEKPAEEKKIRIDVEGEPALVEGYSLLLGEMAFNLVENAVKYTEPGGRVTVQVSRSGGRATLSVSDNGIGIPKEHQDHVFERFYRVDKSHSRASGGTGLGLSIVKHGAAIHDADLRLESEPGRGTRVAMTFREAEALA